jgi:hypothetical protein
MTAFTTPVARRASTSRWASRRGFCGAVSLLMLVLAGCGVRTDTAPRDVDPEDRRDISAPVPSGSGLLSGAARIYLVGVDRSGERSSLAMVTRDVPRTANAVVDALLAGPTVTERAARLRTAIPPSTDLNSASFVSPGTLALDVSPDIFEATGDALIDTVAQFVFTMSELDRVNRVLILVDGLAQPWPRGDGQLVSGPLTVFDFPAKVVTSQPDYPSLPAPLG